MSLIRTAVTSGAIAFIAIALVQMAVHTGLTLQGIGISLLLAGVAAVFWMTDETGVKRYEMVLLWCMVLFFGAYMLLSALGVV
jgi:hypothetical protein